MTTPYSEIHLLSPPSLHPRPRREEALRTLRRPNRSVERGRVGSRGYYHFFFHYYFYYIAAL